MDFKHFNFRLVVINELIELGLLDKQMAPIYKKQKAGYYEKYYEEGNSGSGDEFDDNDDFFEDGEDNYYNPHPEMEEEVANIALTEDMLSNVEKISLDTGEIQGMLAPHWHGEDELFQISDISDILLLPNLKEVEFSFALDSEIKDLSPLLKLPNLKKVSTVSTLKPDHFFRVDKTTKKKLEDKGVKVVKAKI
ncbi:MAG: hypothetical protein K0S32_1719 [Bacteroidetes bacterium]|jgi:hypothetical protein|nr:hypothetical protein [Bacteroidota bacterium]